MSEITVKFSLAPWAAEVLPESYQQALALRAQGVAWKLVTLRTGVGYASGWLAEARSKLAPAEIIAVDPANPTALVEAVRKARVEDQDSWGRLMARTGLPEGQVRKAFELGTNIFSEGLRNGKGGRFLADDGKPYAPAPKVGYVRLTEKGATVDPIIAGRIAAAREARKAAARKGAK